MEEIEVKILDVDRRKIEKKLRSMGAKKKFEGEIHAIFYDFPDDSVRKAKGTMRLRKAGDAAYLTYKRFVENTRAKIRQEYEVEVSDYEEMRDILKSLGLVEREKTCKLRTTYELDGAHFELDKHTDQYSYVPDFLEIEAKDLKALYEYVRLLGYTKKDCRPWTILEISRYYSRRYGKHAKKP